MLEISVILNDLVAAGLHILGMLVIFCLILVGAILTFTMQIAHHIQEEERYLAKQSVYQVGDK